MLLSCRQFSCSVNCQLRCEVRCQPMLLRLPTPSHISTERELVFHAETVQPATSLSVSVPVTGTPGLLHDWSDPGTRSSQNWFTTSPRRTRSTTLIHSCHNNNKPIPVMINATEDGSRRAHKIRTVTPSGIFLEHCKPLNAGRQH